MHIPNYFIYIYLCALPNRTPLKQENTKEYKEREAFAAKMAQEIESSDTYKASLALENGDKDEEDAFSAVVRGGSEKTDGRSVSIHAKNVCLRKVGNIYFR